MTHGGSRKGAGRKRKVIKRVLANFTLDPEVLWRLRLNVPPYGRSAFVEAAIQAALKKL